MSARTSELVLNVCGGARMCLPPVLSQTTTYVLLEQEDWFEDEIRFVRRWLRPGMRAVDVGASFGVYTVAIARAVGPGGRVWAFEPTPASMAYLRRNLELNQCTHVALHQAALSDRAGEMPFAVHARSEENAIALDEAPSANITRVRATTLDEVAAQDGWGEVDFLKLDVEGHELQAVLGGAQFFAARSPLVMFEIRATAGLDLRALGPLKKSGYAFFRLLPGRLLLAPFDEQEAVDRYQLNLFACKGERARRLAAQGLLAERGTAPETMPASRAWAEYIRLAPYASTFGFRSGAAGSYGDGLAAYAHSRERDLGPAQQLAWLSHAYGCVAQALEAAGTLPRWISYARLAWELGRRAAAVEALQRAARIVAAESVHRLEEPFLAPSPRYEALASGSGPGDWLKCAVIEQYERLRTHSSLFSAPSSLATIEPILGLPYRSAEMDRRWQLVRMLTGAQNGPQPAPALCEPSEENLNRHFWCPAGRAQRRASSGGAPLRRLLGEGARYLPASAAALAVDFAVYAGLIRLAQVHYLVAAPIGFALGLATIYALSVAWVFAERRLADRRIEFAIFASIGVAGMALNQFIVFAGVEWLALSYELAKLASAAAVFSFNFLARKALLFTRY